MLTRRADAERRRQRLQTRAFASFISGEMWAHVARTLMSGSDAVFQDSDATARGIGQSVRRKKPASILDVMEERGADPAPDFSEPNHRAASIQPVTPAQWPAQRTAQAPTTYGFNGKTEDFGKFASKLKANMALTHRGFEDFMVDIGFNPDRKIKEEYFMKQDGTASEALKVKSEAQHWVLTSLCSV